jgi:[acyl-carrier-protein] S-malonyltransferase
MPGPCAILCPGQGAQAVGMGRAWCTTSPSARAVFAEADEVLGTTLGRPLSTLCFDGPAERLNRTDVSQPAIYTCSVACWGGLQERGAGPVAGLAGLSLGEYTALHLGGAFGFAEGLRLVAERGRLMQEAATASQGGMVALIGADEQQAEEVCDAARGDEVLVPANFNAPGQIVLSGHRTACERAVAAAGERGLRATALVVAGAFHSPLMQPAADRMAAALRQAALQPPHLPVWSNVTAGRHDPDDVELLQRRLVEQVVSPVRWSQSCEAMAAAGYTHFDELAPGSVLRGLMRRINRNLKVQSHDEPSDPGQE